MLAYRKPKLRVHASPKLRVHAGKIRVQAQDLQGKPYTFPSALPPTASPNTNVDWLAEENQPVDTAQVDPKMGELQGLINYLEPLTQEPGEQGQQAKNMIDQIQKQIDSLKMIKDIAGEYYNGVKGDLPKDQYAKDQPSTDQAGLDQAALAQSALELDRFLEDVETRTGELLAAIRTTDAQIKKDPTAFRKQIAQLANHIEEEITKIKPVADSLMSQLGIDYAAPSTSKTPAESISTSDVEYGFPEATEPAEEAKNRFSDIK